MTRPYISKSFDELEQLFHGNETSQQTLGMILDELAYRRKNRKVPELIEKIETALSCANPFGSESERFVNNRAANNDTQLKNYDEKKAVFVPQNWDVEQRTVIELAEDHSSIVEAGPGSGKTAVACARVAYLIESCDLNASKIILISFTRTAVKELRDRIEAFADEPINVAGLQIFTLDSFTWQVLRGLGDDETADLMCSYETNIKHFIEQLIEGDEKLLDYLAEFEHVVLDEGQDLVADRADLAIQIISNLDKGCGVTVFADSAQAIYGFTDDSEAHGSRRSFTVVERILNGEIVGFDRKKLLNVHRTSDPRLKRLFIEGRDRLLDSRESDIEGWKAMKAFISECAHGTTGRVREQELEGKSDLLVLFRTRAEVLMASGYLWSDGIVHKLRMSGVQQRVLPWIGRLLGENDADYLQHSGFLDLWHSRITASTKTPSQSPENAWKLLLDNVGDRSDRIKVPRLREILTRDRPPIDFLIDESNLAGPVLGTIHASKGREANVVHLMLPPDEFMNDNKESDYALNPHEIAEEERVLFVGATRARQKLLIGEGSKMYASQYEKRRIYKKPRNGTNKRMIEVGLSGDIDISSIVDGRLGEEHEALQDWLWFQATSRVDLVAQYEPNLKSYLLLGAEENKPIAVLSKRFVSDLWGIAKVVGNKDGTGLVKPGNKIRHIRMVGVTTVAIPESQRSQLAAPWRYSGFILAPVITGFPTVFFNRWNRQ